MRNWRTGKVLPWLIIGVGVGFRVAQYLGNRSLWGDEVAIALNLRFRTFAQLLHPLSYDQTMPVGLLLVIKSLASVFGYSELVLRLPSLLVGCGLLILTWLLFSKIFEPRVVLLMAAVMAVSEPLIYYSAELKQYGLDALATVLVVWLAVITLKSTTNQAWPKLITEGGVAMFFSQPVIFVLASIGIAAVLDRRFRSSGVWRKCCITAAAVWLAIFGLLLWLSYRSTMQSAYMSAVWSPNFITLSSPDFRDRLSNSLVLTLGIFHIVHIRPIILSGLFLVGLYGITKKSGGLIAVVAAGPFGLVLLAAVLKQYPIATRLVMFSVPILLLIYASGISLIADLIPQGFSNLAFVVLSCALTLPTAVATGRQAIHFNQREASRDLIRTIGARSQEGAVYLVFGKYMQWAYYAGDWSRRELLKQRIDLTYACLRSAQLGYVEGNDEPAGGCVDLDFPAIDHRMEEIVGNPPSAPSRGAQADQAWAEKEAARIAGIKAKSVWLFLPIYNTDVTTGFPKQRKLLEKLESQLGELGCRSLETDSKGDSLAHNFQCGREAVTRKGFGPFPNSTFAILPSTSNPTLSDW
jgi:Dolichyl-phosphate-mannose-protein mannosyltransferase